MRSQPCHLASHEGVAMTLDGRAVLHAKCPGLCVYIDKTVECDCECHIDQGSKLRKAVAAKQSEAPLPVAVAVSAVEPEPARKDTRGPSRRGNGRCECGCGRTTGGRFAPGHDAKLKSQLKTGAMAGSFKDFAELLLRGWVDSAGTADYPFEVEARGVQFAEIHIDLVERRTEYRQANGTDSVST